MSVIRQIGDLRRDMDRARGIERMWRYLDRGTVSASSSYSPNFTLPRHGIYTVSASLVGANTHVFISWLLSTPNQNLNVGWDLQHSKTYSLGSIAIRTYDGGAQYAVSANGCRFYLDFVNTANPGASVWSVEFVRIL